MRALFEHRFACSSDAFWAMYLSTEFSRSFWMEKTGAPRYDSLVEQTAPSGDHRRSFKVLLSGIELPGPLEKMLGGPLGFTEEGSFSKARGEYSYQHTYSALTDRIKVK